MRLRHTAAGLFLLYASPALAQQAETSRFSLNVGAGSVSSISTATPGQAALITIGTDVRLSANWSLRVEAGRRAPGTRHWVNRETMYYLEPPDGGPSIGVAATVVASDETLVDYALLVRRAWPHGDRFGIGLLTGLDFQVVRYRWRTTIPTSLTDPDQVEEFVSDNRRTHGAFDVGLDGGLRVGDRWHVIVFGMAGLPLQEHQKTQFRAGAILKRTFR